MSEENPQRECRCCRKPVHPGQLACRKHWELLPQPLRTAISTTYRKRRDWRAYAANVREADKVWQDMGLWRPGVPSISDANA